MATFTNTWDETIPLNDSLVGLSEAGKIDALIRQLKLDIRERILKYFPVGMVVKWSSDYIPPGFMECKGDSLVRTEKPLLFGVIGTTYGAADSLHFNIPKISGRFLRGWNHGKAAGFYDPDAATRTKITTAGSTMTAGDHVGTEEEDENKAHGHLYSRLSAIIVSIIYPYIAETLSETTKQTENAGENESRPFNIYQKYIIRVDDIDIDGEFIREWDENNPVSTDRMGLMALELRKLKKDIEERILNIFAPGIVMWWPSDTVPYGYEECDGAELSRTTYSELFDWIGDMYGPGDGYTTFNKPNLKGYFIRAQDSGAGIDTGTRTARPDGVTGDYNGTIESDAVKIHNHDYKKYDLGTVIYSPFPDGAPKPSASKNSVSSPERIIDGRPKNIYLMPIIRTVPI